MRSFVLIALSAAAAISAPAASSATAQTRSQSFPIAPNQAQLQPVSVRCADGEQLVGGGYATESQGLRVTSSYPDSAASWTVVVWNPSRTTAPLRVHARCLSGADGRTSIQSVAGQPPAERIECPKGTVVTGGGYRSSWAPRVGGPAVTGSHPSTGNGWVVEAARVPGDAGGSAGTQKIEVFAVCLGGKATGSPSSVTMTDVAAGSPSCLAVPNFAQQCTYPRTASQKLGCSSGEVLSSSGYQVTAGTLPGDSVLAAGVEDFAMSGISRDNSPMTVRLTPVCLTWLANPAPVSMPWVWPAGAAALLLLLLLAVLLLRSKKPKPPSGGTGLQVTVKSQRSAFRFDRLREVP
jgi:hypothetical protein